MGTAGNDERLVHRRPLQTSLFQLAWRGCLRQLRALRRLCARPVRASLGSASGPWGPPVSRPPPRAFRVSGALPATMMLIAAFRSRSMTRPQASQRYVRTERGSLAFTAPHPEHVLLLGYQRSMTCMVMPVRTHLHSSSRRNSPNEASSTAWARLWLATIPATLRSSIEISEQLLARWVVSFSRSSRRWLATRAWMRWTRCLALARRPDPLCLRERSRWALASLRSDAWWRLGFPMTVPSESVARWETPRSTPTAGPLGWEEATSARSTVREASQRPARQETVIRVTWAPPTRRATSSMQWTRPILGSLRALGSPSMRPNEPVV